MPARSDNAWIGILLTVSANHVSYLSVDATVDDVARSHWLMHATSEQGNATKEFHVPYPLTSDL